MKRPDTERDVIESAGDRPPVTSASLVEDLRALGVSPGMNLIVHSALSRLGWVVGGAPAVIDALIRTLGDRGTLVMPTHSSQLTEPSNWNSPPVPDHWWPIIRSESTPYDSELTPSRHMGTIAETFRRHSHAVRSGHPHTSFTAIGPLAEQVTRDHRPGCMMGEASPIGRLYELDAHVLLLGVDHSNNSSIHLAEYRADFDGKKSVQEGAPMIVDGVRQWVQFEDLCLNDDDFAAFGEAFAATGRETRGSVGWGEGRLSRVRELVDYAARWFAEHR